MCKLCLKGENFDAYFEKLNFFSEKVQFRRDFLRLRQMWTEEIENKEMLMLPSMKQIENLNLRDWSSIRRFNEPIRLNEKRSVYLEN